MVTEFQEIDLITKKKIGIRIKNWEMKNKAVCFLKRKRRLYIPYEGWQLQLIFTNSGKTQATLRIGDEVKNLKPGATKKFFVDSSQKIEILIRNEKGEWKRLVLFYNLSGKNLANR